MKLQLLSLSVCLCLSFSVSAAPGSETAVAQPDTLAVCSPAVQLADSLRFVAIMRERDYYYATDSGDAETFLLEKASLLFRAGDREESLRTLTRVNAFLLPPQGREEYEKLLHSLSLEACNAEPPGQDSDAHSAFWAFVPPIGHCLAGETLRGLMMTLLDAGELAFGIWQACSGNWITAYIIGAGGLYQTYFKEGVRIVPKISRQFKNNP